ASRRSEPSVPALARREVLGARLALAGIVRRLAQRELVGHGGGERQPDALPRRAPIAPDAAWREVCDVTRQRLRFLAGVAGRHNAVVEPEAQGFSRLYRATGQDHVKGAGETDELRQPHRAPVDQWHAP